MLPPEMPSENDASKENRSALEKVLSLMAEVHSGEGVTALMLTGTVFLLMTAYYVIKPVREGLILAMDHGNEKKSYVAGAIAIVLLFAVPAYSSVANRVAKHKLVVGVTLFFASNLVLFFFASVIPPIEKELGLIFFTWVGVFNMMVIAQFWGFAADIYTQDKGKRLFAIVGFGASLGAAVGAYITGFLQDVVGLSLRQLMVVAAGILVGAAFLTQAVHAREKRLSSGDHEAKKQAEKAAENQEKLAAEAHPQNAYMLVLRNKYLLLIATFALIYTVVDTNGEYILSTLVEDRAADLAHAKGLVDEKAIHEFSKSYIAGYYSSFFLWVNVIGTTIQMFLVSRIVKYGGLKIAFLVYPVIALGSSLNAITVPTVFGVDRLSAFRPTKTAENATDYSLNATTRNMLWLPTTQEMKYKAKQVIDAFCVRMGDVLSAGAVFVFAHILKWPVRNFSMINVGIVVVWLLVARSIIKENARLTEEKADRESQPPPNAKAEVQPEEKPEEKPKAKPPKPAEA